MGRAPTHLEKWNGVHRPSWQVVPAVAWPQQLGRGLLELQTPQGPLQGSCPRPYTGLVLAPCL